MDWNWSHNGLGGGVAWDFTNKNLATAHLSPSNPKLVAKRKQKIEQASQQTQHNRHLHELGWAIQIDATTGYEYYWNECTHVSQWGAPSTIPSPHSNPTVPHLPTHTVPHPPNTSPPRKRARLLKARRCDYTPGEWRELQQRERQILQQEAEAKQLEEQRRQIKQNFVYARVRIAVQVSKEAMKQTYRRLRRRGCQDIVYPAGSLGSVLSAKDSMLGMQFVPRQTSTATKGCMVAQIDVGSKAEKAGLRRGCYLVEINGIDVTEISTVKQLYLVMTKNYNNNANNQPLTLSFRAAPSKMDQTMRIFVIIENIQKNYRRKRAVKRNKASVEIEAMIRGHLHRKIAVVQKITIYKKRASITIQTCARGRQGRDRVRILKVLEMGVTQHIAGGWFVRKDFTCLGGATFYIHQKNKARIEWTVPDSIRYPIWEKLYDASTSCYYYYNTRTMQCQWDMPDDYYEPNDDDDGTTNEAQMPYGVQLLRAASKIQSAYRAKLARDMIKSIKRVKILEQEIHNFTTATNATNATSTDGGPTNGMYEKFEELGRLFFEIHEWNKCTDMLSKAIDDFHIRQHMIKHKQKALKNAKERKDANSNVGGQKRRKAFQLKSSTRKTTRVGAPLGVNVSECLYMLAVSLYHQFQSNSNSITLRHAMYALKAAFLYRSNNANPKLLFLSAKIYSAFGAFESALKILSRLITTMPHWPAIDQVVFFAASILKGLGRLDAAKTYFNWIKTSPYIANGRIRSYLLHFQIAHIYLLEAQHSTTNEEYYEKYENAMLAFQKVHQMHPTLGSSKNGSNGGDNLPSMATVECFLNSADTWNSMKEPLGMNMECPILAAECLSQCLDIENIDQHAQTPQMSYDIATAAMQAGNRTAAIAWAKVALDKAPFSNQLSETIRLQLIGWEAEIFHEKQMDIELNGTDQMMNQRGVEEWHVRGAIRLQRWVRKIYQMDKYTNEAPIVRWNRKINNAATKIQQFWLWSVWIEKVWKPMKIKKRWKNPTQYEIAMVLRCQVRCRIKNGSFGKHMKRQAKRYKKENDYKLNQAALRVQGAWRKKKGTYSSYILARAQNDQRKDLEERGRAAVRLQCAWRRKKGTFAQHMLKSAQRDVEKDALIAAELLLKQIEEEKVRQLKLKQLNEMKAANQLVKWWKNRHFRELTNIVEKVQELIRIEKLVTKVQSHARGMKIRNWMTKRHRIATTTASVFRGYVGRMGIRLKKKLKRQRAAMTINQFVHEARLIQKREFVKRDQSALQIQSFIRGFLVRWRSHHDFSTAVSLWGLEVLHDRLGRPVSKDTARAVEDGTLLANAIWCRYPCPNPGVLFQAARATNDVALAKKKIQDRTSTKKKKRKIAWSEKRFMKSFTKASIFKESTQRATPQSIGRHIPNIQVPTLQPTYMNSSVPSYMLSKAVRIAPSPSFTLSNPSSTTAEDLKHKNIVRWTVPRAVCCSPPATATSIRLAWGSEAAKSLQLDVQALLVSRKKEWDQRHSNRHVKQSKKRAKQEARKLVRQRKALLLS